MKLVSDARNWWKWHSTWVFAVLAIFPAVWLASPDLQALLPPRLVSIIAPPVAAIGFFLRLRAQAVKLPTPKPTVPPPRDSRQGNSL